MFFKGMVLNWPDIMNAPEMPVVKISGFVKPSEQIIGVIYDHSIAGIWTDICVEYNDGESLTVSNAPMGQEMDHMPGVGKNLYEGKFSGGTSLKSSVRKEKQGAQNNNQRRIFFQISRKPIKKK